MRTVQERVPEQAPDQPAKRQSSDRLAVRVTVAPLLNCAEQALGQLIPDGLLVTRPRPLTETMSPTREAELTVTVRVAGVVQRSPLLSVTVKVAVKAPAVPKVTVGF